MSDLFKDDEGAVVEEVEIEEDFADIDSEVDVDVEGEVVGTILQSLDARRRLENMLDEKRLRDELDDFGDY